MGQKSSSFPPFTKKYFGNVTSLKAGAIRFFSAKLKKKNEGKKPYNQWSFLNFIFCLI